MTKSASSIISTCPMISTAFSLIRVRRKLAILMVGDSSIWRYCAAFCEYVTRDEHDLTFQKLLNRVFVLQIPATFVFKFVFKALDLNHSALFAGDLPRQWCLWPSQSPAEILGSSRARGKATLNGNGRALTAGRP